MGGNSHSNVPGKLKSQSAQSGLTASAATDTFTLSGHGLIIGDPISLSNLVGGAGIPASPATLYVISATVNTFQASATFGGSTIDITSDLTSATIQKLYSWFNAKQDFPPGDLANISRSYIGVNGASANLADGTLLNMASIRQFWAGGNLP